MGRITREALLARQQRKTIEVADPETGETFLMRMISARDKDEFDASLKIVDGRVTNMDNLRGRLLAKCIVDPQLTADEWGDEDTVLVGFLFVKAQSFNGITPVAVDDAAKNSTTAPSGDSSSV